MHPRDPIVELHDQLNARLIVVRLELLREHDIAAKQPANAVESGIGAIGMRECIYYVGGTIETRTKIHAGTTIVIVLPMPVGAK